MKTNKKSSLAKKESSILQAQSFMRPASVLAVKENIQHHCCPSDTSSLLSLRRAGWGRKKERRWDFWQLFTACSLKKQTVKNTDQKTGHAGSNINELTKGVRRGLAEVHLVKRTPLPSPKIWVQDLHPPYRGKTSKGWSSATDVFLPFSFPSICYQIKVKGKKKSFKDWVLKNMTGSPTG